MLHPPRSNAYLVFDNQQLIDALCAVGMMPSSDWRGPLNWKQPQLTQDRVGPLQEHALCRSTVTILGSS